jgi:paraquat-inducible protein A
MNNNSNQFPKGTAASLGLANCSVCGSLLPVSVGNCTRCGKQLELRRRDSVQVTLALVLTAIIFYIPANVLPIMTTNLLGSSSPATILGGVVIFLEHGSYGIALVIFTASVLIPIAKMAVITRLCLAVRSQKQLKHNDLTKLYRVVEFIGKWSMIDVFVVAILVALIQLSGLMVIRPGIAISAFAGVVVLTMVAAHEFDVRLIWDKETRL